MKILFINASRDVHGAVAGLARQLIEPHHYSVINLVNRDVKQLGQPGSRRDDFRRICQQVSASQLIVLGTPVYCLDMSGYLKTFIDRMSEILLNHWSNPFAGKKLYLVVNYTVTPEAVGHISQVVATECQDMNIRYLGVVSDLPSAKRAKLQ